MLRQEPSAVNRRRAEAHLQLPHELNQIVLFLGSEFEFQDQIEELHRVFQCQKSAVMEIRRAFLDTPQRERLNRYISCFVFSGIARRGGRASGYRDKPALDGMEHCALPKNNLSPASSPAVAFAGPSLPVTVSFGAGGKSNIFCIWAMCDTGIRSRMFMPFLMA